jgi:lipase chaperone LimK
MMRTIKLATGVEVPLDGDLLTIMESLFHEFTDNPGENAFEQTVAEIKQIVSQMSEEERKQYLAESLFLNYVSYENERLSAYMKKLTKKA